MTRPFDLTAWLVVLGATLCGCDRKETPTATPQRTTPLVFTVNFPLESFARELGETKVQVELPKLDGHHADDFQPTPAEVVRIQEANLILLNGAGFSPWAAHASLPRSRTVVTAASFKPQWIESTHNHDHDHDHDHQHGPDGDGVHHEGHWASFTWLDPAHARAQAMAVGLALQRLLPQDARTLEQRTDELARSLDSLVAQANRIKGLQIPTLIAAEPHYQYFAAACGLDLLDADWHWEEPEPHEGLDSLAGLAEASGARYIIVPEQPSAERLELLTRFQLQPVIVDPLGNPPAAGDGASFVEKMRRNLDAIEALAPAQPTG